LIFEVQCKHVIRDDAKLQAVRYFHLPPKWPVLPGTFVCHCKLAAGQKSNSRFAAGEFNRHHHISNQECMFKEYPAHSSVLLAPPDLAKARAKVVPEECRAFAAQAIHHVTRTTLVIVVDLGARTFQEAVMVKQFQPA